MLIPVLVILAEQAWKVALIAAVTVIVCRTHKWDVLWCLILLIL